MKAGFLVMQTLTGEIDIPRRVILRANVSLIIPPVKVRPVVRFMLWLRRKLFQYGIKKFVYCICQLEPPCAQFLETIGSNRPSSYSITTVVTVRGFSGKSNLKGT